MSDRQRAYLNQFIGSGGVGTEPIAETHIANGTGAHTASAITNVPAGTVSATNVQTAIDEVASEKAALAGATFTGSVRIPRLGVNVASSSFHQLFVGGVHTGTGTLSYGLNVEIDHPSTATALGCGARIQGRTAAAAFTCTDLVGVQIDTPSVGAGSTATNVYGLKIETQTGAGTAAYGIAVSAATTQALWMSYALNSVLAADGIGFGQSDDTVIFRKAVNTVGINAGGAAKTVSASVGGTIFDHFADVGNGATVETDLISDSVAASSLAANGHKLVGNYAGTFAANATTKQLKVYFGGTAVFDSGAQALAAVASSWTVKVWAIRVSATVVRVATEYEGSALIAPQYTEVTGLTLTNAQILKITGTAGVGGANNDIVVKMGTVDFKPAA